MKLRSNNAGSALAKSGAQIHEHQLDNGLKILLVERHLDPVVAVMVWYKAGARDEEEREAGVSHFLEHMMFKGSAAFGKGEVDRITTILGGSNNAFTGSDHTAYWFELSSDRFEKALEIEADRMRCLLLEQKEFEAEKAVVLEELSMGEDDPWRSLTELVQSALFVRHPYRRPVIGYPDTLRNLSVDDMRDYYKRFYHPGNATIVVCGDIQPGATLALVQQYFGAIPRGPVNEKSHAYRPPLGEPRGEQRISMSWDDQGQRLCMAWPSVTVGSDEDFVLDLISTVLSGGRLSRLHRKLVIEKQLATSITTQNDVRVDGGAFWLFAECAQGVEPKQLESAIAAELKRLCDERVPAAELTRAKRMIRANEAHESETVSDLAEEIGEFAIDARWQLALETIARIEKVSASALRTCAARLLRDERRVVGWCLPRKQPAKRKATAKRGGRA